MSNISRSVLFGKLNTTLYKTLENAYTFCRLRENSYVEWYTGYTLYFKLKKQISSA